MEKNDDSGGSIYPEEAPQAALKDSAEEAEPEGSLEDLFRGKGDAQQLKAAKSEVLRLRRENKRLGLEVRRGCSA